MKRKHWQPGGGDNVNGDLRGIDEWERISWDEALDMVADGITRIKETYGNRAILGSGQQPTNRTYVDYEMYIDFPDFFIKGCLLYTSSPRAATSPACRFASDPFVPSL